MMRRAIETVSALLDDVDDELEHMGEPNGPWSMAAGLLFVVTVALLLIFTD